MRADSPALLIALLLPAVGFLTSCGSGGSDNTVAVGSLSDFAPGSVTAFEEDGFFIVHAAGGEIIALSNLDPGPLGCRVRWRPDFVWEGTSGWFRDPCVGSTYRMDGTREYGPARRGLDRLKVKIEDNSITVHPNTYLCGYAPPSVECYDPDSS
jgi:hypothetical protein